MSEKQHLGVEALAGSPGTDAPEVSPDLARWLLSRGWTPPGREEDLASLTEQIRELEHLQTSHSIVEDLAVARVRFVHAAGDRDALTTRAADAMRRAEELIADQTRRLREVRTRLEALSARTPSRPVEDLVDAADRPDQVAQPWPLLASRQAIAQAVGIVMLTARCDAGDAWAVLVVWSNTTNLKLRQLAEEICESTSAGQLNRGAIRSWHAKAGAAGRLRQSAGGELVRREGIEIGTTLEP